MTKKPASKTIGALLVDVSIEDEDWNEALADGEALTERAALAAWNFVGGPEQAEVSVVLLDDGRQQALNRDYRSIDRPTNVLSFATEMDTPPTGAPRLLGDITLAFETVAREAQAQDKALANHFCHLVVHGMLHLAGYDHEDKTDADQMEQLEIKILETLDIGDPYDDQNDINVVTEP